MVLLTMNLTRKVTAFLQLHSDPRSPLLLGLSGGPDSLCLFHCLLESGIPFHVAHVDHGWRPESSTEAAQLAELAAKHDIPFHLKKLDPQQMKGNLEAACREIRYKFFKEICLKYACQGVVLGHQADDQAETVLKRMLEGSHWASIASLKPVTINNDVKVFRPLLSISKSDVLAWLKERDISYFSDATNLDPRYLRGRMRTEILPWLSQAFGKEVSSSLQAIGAEASELREFLDERVSPYMDKVVKGKLGTYLDLSDAMPTSLLEMKHLIRAICSKEHFALPRDSLHAAAELLMKGSADRFFSIERKQVHIDRKKIFIIESLLEMNDVSIKLNEGTYQYGSWRVTVEKNNNTRFLSSVTSWREAWHGKMEVSLPNGDYHLELPKMCATYHQRSSKIGKWLTDHHVPSFLKSALPVIWMNGEVHHEFLTGRPPLATHSEFPAIKITLEYTHS